MKFSGGISQYEASTGKWIYSPRNYTDFHCTLKEWKNLNRGQINFINQLLCEIWYDESLNKEDFNFIHPYKEEDKTPYPFFSEIPEKDGNIISYCIQRVTGLKTKCYVNFYDSDMYGGILDNVIIEFDNYDKNILPNIIVLIDDDVYVKKEIQGVIKMILDAVYQTIKNFEYESFNKYYKPYYNNNYDLIFNKVENVSSYSDMFRFPDIFRPKKTRKITSRRQIEW